MLLLVSIVIMVYFILTPFWQIFCSCQLIQHNLFKSLTILQQLQNEQAYDILWIPASTFFCQHLLVKKDIKPSNSAKSLMSSIFIFKVKCSFSSCSKMAELSNIICYYVGKSMRDIRISNLAKSQMSLTFILKNNHFEFHCLLFFQTFLYHKPYIFASMCTLTMERISAG